MMNKCAINILWVLCLLLSSPALASTTASVEMTSVEEQIYFSEDELVTGPTKSPIPVGESPVNITIITHEDIIESGAQNLPEVFRRVPGMNVFWIHSGEDVASIRGFAGPLLDGERVAVLIDGRTFYYEVGSYTVWYQIPVPLDDIKRIEIIKGPMSPLYGNKAMLGVINIVTYEPEETHTLLGAGGGRFYTILGKFINAGEFADGYWYKVTGNFRRLSDYTDFDNDGSKGKASQTAAFSGKIKMKPVEGTEASLSGTYVQNRTILNFGGLVGRGSPKRGTLEGKLEQDLGKWGKLSAHGYWDRVYLQSDFASYRVISDTVDAEARHLVSFDITEDIKNTLTYGFNYRYNAIINFPIKSIQDFAGFLQNEIRFFDRILLSGGFRADYQMNLTGLNTSAHGNLVFFIHPRYTLRLGIGTSFNSPSFIQAYFSTSQPANSPIPFVNNLGLKSERILYFNLSNTIQPIDKLKITADLFYYRLNKVLTPAIQATSPTTVQLLFTNDGGQRSIGGEIGFEGIIASWLKGYANFSYQDFSPINGNANQTPNLGNPKYKAGGGLRGNWFDSRLRANMDFYYVHSFQRQNGVMNFVNTPFSQVGDTYLLNMRVGYWPIKHHLEIAVAANNILNDNSPQVPAVDPATGTVLAERPQFNFWGSVRYIF